MLLAISFLFIVLFFFVAIPSGGWGDSLLNILNIKNMIISFRLCAPRRAVPCQANELVKTSRSFIKLVLIILQQRNVFIRSIELFVHVSGELE